MQKIFEKHLPVGHFEIYDDKPFFECHHVHQVHSAKIIDLKNIQDKADGILFPIDFPEKIAIKTADCMPIIMLGKKNHIFLHAGWKGLANGILTHKLIKQISPFYVFIGASIHPCHFEVQKDFYSNFPKSKNFIEKEDKIFFDLQKEAQDILNENYPGLQIETSSECTHCDNKYNSYRRDKSPKRNWNIWTLSV